MRGNRSLPQPREDRTMQHVLRFTVLILFGFGLQLLGCSDAPSPMTAPDSEETAGPGTTLAPEPLAPEPVAIEPTSAEETFARLRNLFPQPIVDADFTTLRKVVDSNTYLDFLAREFPTEKPFQTFAAYLRGAPPDAERYLPLLKKWVGTPTEEDIEVLHWVTLEHREANLLLFRFKVRPDGNVFQRIKGIFDKKFGALADPRVETFLARHHIAEEEFIAAVNTFVPETEQADARWLHAQFEEQNGIDEGLLWSALRKPALIGEILHNFAETEVFLKWVDSHRRL